MGVTTACDRNAQTQSIERISQVRKGRNRGGHEESGPPTRIEGIGLGGNFLFDLGRGMVET
jgi:hypothetical protein